MEPDEQGDGMPTGVPLSPERVINALQQRAAGIIQNLTMDIALRDATIEVLEEQLAETKDLLAEAEGALTELAATKRPAGGALQPDERDAFLEATASLAGRPGLDGGGQSAGSSDPTA